MGLRIYLDSCIVIYLVEEHPDYAPRLEEKISQLNDVTFLLSHLTELECLVIPIRNKNKLLLDKFQSFFKNLRVSPLERPHFHRAANLRAKFVGLKTPDALHLATALNLGCNEFWTNDDHLERAAPQFARNILRG